jgi:hypothetical protein
MRCLYLTCISLSLVLFLGNHVHARIGETYEESVKRYEKAGFTKERTTTTIPPDDKELGYCVMKTSQSKSVLNRQGVTELTWTNGGPVARQTVGVVLIKQFFFGKWPPTRRPKPWQDVLHCFEITYKFRDATDPESTNFKTWMRKVLAASTGDAELNFAWQYERSSSKLGRYYYPSIQFQNVPKVRIIAFFDIEVKTLHIKFEHDDFEKHFKEPLETVLGALARKTIEADAIHREEAISKLRQEKTKMLPPPPPVGNVAKEFEDSGL